MAQMFMRLCSMCLSCGVVCDIVVICWLVGILAVDIALFNTSACGSEVAENELTRALLSFVNVCAAAQLPPDLVPFLTAAKLIPLRKKTDTSEVCPIAAGETLCRIVEQAVLRKTVDAAQKMLTPLQVGPINVAVACSTPRNRLKNV